MIKELLIILILFLIQPIKSQPSISSVNFPKKLLQEKNYTLATLELERHLFENVNDTIAFSLLLNAYNLSSNYSQTIDKYYSYKENNNTFLHNADIQLSWALLALEKHDTLRQVTKQFNFSSPDKEVLHAGIYLQKGDFLKSYAILLSTQEKSQKLNFALDVANEAMNLKLKSTRWSIGLSTVFPGGGQFYCNQWKEGMINLTSVAILGVNSYHYFTNEGYQSPRGWVFSVVAGMVYLSGIISSYESAIQYNQLELNKIKTKYLQVVIQPLGF